MGSPSLAYKIYHTLKLVVNILSLLPMAIYYIPRFTRPHPNFTIRQGLGRKLLFSLMQFYTDVHLASFSQNQLAGTDSNFIEIPTADQQYYRGPLEDSQIHPKNTGGTWYPSKPSNEWLKSSSDKVMLHFHGGGYLLGSSLPIDCWYMAKMMNTQVAPFALFLEYRLSDNPEGRFPAALQDAVSGYQYLIDLGVEPKNIIVSGDSAGGHLALSLLRYINDHMKGLMLPPSCALLWSAWIEVSRARPVELVLHRKNYETDYLPANFAVMASNGFAPQGIVDENSEYVNLKPFQTPTKLWFHAGGLEMLHDEIQVYANSMREISGNEVEISVDDYALHDIAESGYLNGFAKEAEDAAIRAGQFVHRVFETNDNVRK